VIGACRSGGTGSRLSTSLAIQAKSQTVFINMQETLLLGKPFSVDMQVATVKAVLEAPR
jgi:hypothetical protein